MRLPPPWSSWLPGEQGYGSFGQVAAFADLPFVMGFDEHGAARRSRASGLGRTPTSVRRLISLLTDSGLVLQIFSQWLTGKPVNAVTSTAASRSTTHDGMPSAPHGGDDAELLADLGRAWLGEDGPDGRGDHLCRAFGDLGEDVAQEVDVMPGDKVHLIHNTFHLASKRDWDAPKRDNKPVYAAVNAAAARAAMDQVTETWGSRHPAIIRLWDSAWEHFIPFLD